MSPRFVEIAVRGGDLAGRELRRCRECRRRDALGDAGELARRRRRGRPVSLREPRTGKDLERWRALGAVGPREPAQVALREIGGTAGLAVLQHQLRAAQHRQGMRLRRGEQLGCLGGPPLLSSQLAETFLSPARIEAILLAAGAPTTPAQIHLDRPFYEAAMLHGREIRNRYTVLDVMAGTGRLAKSLPAL